MPEMSDAEVLCSFMEPKPTVNKDMVEEFRSAEDLAKFWRWGWRYVGPSLPQQQTPVEYCWLPIRITLNECHRIEAKLTAPQWRDYRREMRLRLEREDGTFPLGERVKAYLHADAPTKLAALAAVLRTTVEAKTK